MTVASESAASWAKTFKPWAIIDTPLGTMEAVSYPFVEGNKVYVMMRTMPGDATTMQRFELLHGKLVLQDTGK